MTEDAELVRDVKQLHCDGFVVLRGLYDASTVEAARSCVIENRGLLRNTRPLPSAGHLAGFHRYPVLEPLHTLISGQPSVHAVLHSATGCSDLRTIGLSDITVNRSQEWHVDLLRGVYRHHLNDEICWGAEGGGVYKILLYLQPGQSLKVLAGAHARPVSLEVDIQVEPADFAAVTNVEVCSGDVVVMDLRLPHRGSTDEQLRCVEHLPPKILVSTVLAAAGRQLTAAMERGNSERLIDWEDRNEMRRLRMPFKTRSDAPV